MMERKRWQADGWVSVFADGSFIVSTTRKTARQWARGGAPGVTVKRVRITEVLQK